jgi:hypothetical protein
VTPPSLVDIYYEFWMNLIPSSSVIALTDWDHLFTLHIACIGTQPRVLNFGPVLCTETIAVISLLEHLKTHNFVGYMLLGGGYYSSVI